MSFKVKCYNCKEIFEFEFKKDVFKVCPKCNANYMDKPHIERVLFLLQDEFILKNDNKILEKMYPDIVIYSSKIISKTILKNRKSLKKDDYINNTPIFSKARDVANLLILDYLDENKKDFRIENSFYGYLFWKIKQEFYAIKDIQNDACSSLSYINANEDDNINFFNKLNYKYNTLKENDKNLITNINIPISILMKDIYKIIEKSYYDYQKELSYVDIFWVITGISSFLTNRLGYDFFMLDRSLNIKNTVEKVLDKIKRYLNDNG